MREDLTHIVIILDRSGSMQSIKSDMEGALNKFIEDQNKVEGEAVVTFVRFDNEYEEVFVGVPIENVAKLELQPRGMTALLDAIGKTVNTVGERFANMDESERPGGVIVVIITDGMENASREFTSDQVKAMIQEQTNTYKWVFTYLGADHDSFDVSRSIGIASAHTMNYSKSHEGTQCMFSAVGQTVTAYRATKTFNGYDDKQREDSMK